MPDKSERTGGMKTGKDRLDRVEELLRMTAVQTIENAKQVTKSASRHDRERKRIEAALDSRLDRVEADLEKTAADLAETAATLKETNATMLAIDKQLASITNLIAVLHQSQKV
jgi:hypothetical protein